jgi:hypothetical protein
LPRSSSNQPVHVVSGSVNRFVPLGLFFGISTISPDARERRILREALLDDPRDDATRRNDA